NSVRVSDEFMHAVVTDGEWWTRSVANGKPVKRHEARELLRQMAEAAHQCGDPGLQFDDTINRWHTCKESGRVNASNPCCFVGETLIDTSEGRIPFSVLESMYANGKDLPFVFAYDTAKREPVLRRIRRVWKAGSTSHLVQVAT